MSRRQWLGLPLVLSLLLSACMVWTAPAAAPAAVSRANGQTVRVERTDHSTITVNRASVRNDSIVGVATDGSGAPVAIAMADVQGVSTRDVSPGRTLGAVGLVGLAALGALAIFVIIVVSTSNWNGS